MVNSHACISKYLQIDQDTSSRRDDSSSKHVSNYKFIIFSFRQIILEVMLMSAFLFSYRKPITNEVNDGNSERRDNGGFGFLLPIRSSWS
jgi:hypothetical protein